MDDRPQLDDDLADTHPIAERRAEPRQSGFLDDRPPHAIAPGERDFERDAIAQLHRAIERVGILDRLELDQRRTLLRLDRPCHGAAIDPAHQRAALAHRRHLLGRGLAIEQRDRNVAAQDLAGIGA